MTPLAAILSGAIRLYQWVLSPAQVFLFGPTAGCRFQPTCSHYALQAIQTHGPLKGARLTTLRLCRCHPWGGSGPDPVPAAAWDETSHGVNPAEQPCKFHG